MKIEKIEWKNFNSYGNKTQVLEMPLDTGFFLVSGQNGAGKTTMREVIEFLLYGKVNGKKLQDLPNRINKNLWGRITLVSKNKRIVIEAGQSPSFINLWVDGEPYKKAGKRGPREYLVEELLEFPFHVFNSIISISINDFKSFLKMNAEDKRRIVDKIFGFQIINTMREVLNKRSKDLSDNLAVAVKQMDNAKHSLDSSLAELEDLNKKMTKMSLEAIGEAKEQVDRFSKAMEYHNQLVAEFDSKDAAFRKSLQELNSMIWSTKSDISKMETDIDVYNNDKCPRCKSDLTTDFHVEQKKEIASALDRLKADLEEKNQLLSEYKGIESKHNSDRSTFIEKKSKIEFNINAWKTKLKDLETNKDDQQAESIKNIIQKMEELLKNSEQDKAKTEEYMKWNSIIEDVLGEKGVKQLAVKTILPSLNQEIGKLMLDMHLDYKVTFDEEFNATVRHFNDEISIASLSRGEMKKVDFVVLISVIRLMKMRFPSINLLFLDEILDGLDGEAIYLVIKVLSKSLRELDLNTFIISFGHSLEEIESFDYKIIIEKQNNFSNLRIEKNQ